MTKTFLSAAAALAFVAALAGCDARRSEPLGSAPKLDTSQLVRGESVFMAHCNQCHPGGEAGLGPSLNDKPAPGFLMKAQVRRGFGAMPAFEKDEINDRELDELVLYLKAMR